MNFPGYVYVTAAVLFILCELTWLWQNLIH